MTFADPLFKRRHVDRLIIPLCVRGYVSDKLSDRDLVKRTVNGCLQHTFGLSRERPHTLDGFQARLAAKATLHTFGIWLNQQLGRPPLALHVRAG